MKLHYVLYISVILVITACENESKKKTDDHNNISDIEVQSNPGELTIYTIPSPVLVSNTLKLFNIDFNAELLSFPEKDPKQMVSNYSKALNLGKYIVDFSYTSVFEQTQHSINYLNYIDKLMSELNIRNPETIFAVEKFKNNISNPDSLSNLIVDFQNKLNGYYSEQENDELSLLIISGIYIEGFYIALNYHDAVVRNHFNDHLSQVNCFKNMIFQQKIYLESLNELMSSVKDDTNKPLIDYYKKLTDEFDKMNFTYDLNAITNKIENISYRRSEIDNLKSLVQEIRTYIINT